MNGNSLIGECGVGGVSMWIVIKAYMVSMILFSVAVFERSLVDTFSSGSDYLEMWTAYCDYYRRLVTMDTTQEQHSHEDLLELFKRARNKLKEGTYYCSYSC